MGYEMLQYKQRNEEVLTSLFGANKGPEIEEFEGYYPGNAFDTSNDEIFWLDIRDKQDTADQFDLTSFKLWIGNFCFDNGLNSRLYLNTIDRLYVGSR